MFIQLCVVVLDDPVTERSSWLATAGIAFATPFLVWFAIGDVSFRGSGGVGLFYEWGPYQVGPESGYVLVGVAGVILAAGVALLVLRTREGEVDRRLWWVAVVLAAAGSLGAAAWRVMTAGVVGANIGGGMVLLVGPVLIAGLLVLAVRLAGGGGQRLRRTRLLTLVAVLVAPALYSGLFALRWYDASAGVITARQYADVRIGQARSAVHDTLGREGADLTYIFFEPPAPGLRCDFYNEANESHAYEFCFRAGLLVRKDFRTRPFAG
jgi:hypothetical protein